MRLWTEQARTPGKQHFEKMVAGMYIGDICLRIYRDLHPEGRAENEGKNACTMDSRVCSDIEAGENKLGFQFFEDMQRICRAVSDRSIRLVATMIMAILTHIRTPSDTVVVAIDGAMYTRYHQYKERLQQAVNEIAAQVDYEAQVLLVGAADQSSVGAAASNRGYTVLIGNKGRLLCSWFVCTPHAVAPLSLVPWRSA